MSVVSEICKRTDGQINVVWCVADLTESRTWGHEAKQRPRRDQDRPSTLVLQPTDHPGTTEGRRRDEARPSTLVLLTDPTQTSLGDAVIRGWQTFVNIVSVQHGVYLQVRTSFTCISYQLAEALVG